jgi:hypothetical protein
MSNGVRATRDQHRGRRTTNIAGNLLSALKPDPTERTVEQMQDAIAAAREILETKAAGNVDLLVEKIEGVKGIVDTKISAIDTSTKLLQTISDRVPQQIRDEVEHLSALHNEKFASVITQIKIQFEGIATQFGERDKRTEQLSLADKTAIAAALQAQKEAAGATNDSIIAVITKMDASFTKLFDQMTNLLSAMQKNTDEKIKDIKDQMSVLGSRIDKREGVSSTMDPITAESIAWMKQQLAGNQTFQDKSGGVETHRLQASSQNMMMIQIFATVIAATMGVVIGHFLH